MSIGQARADPWIDPDGDVRADRGSVGDKRFETRVGHASFDAPNMRSVHAGRTGYLGDARAGIDLCTHEVVGDLALDSPCLSWVGGRVGRSAQPDQPQPVRSRRLIRRSWL
jgi:hypothetical protein